MKAIRIDDIVLVSSGALQDMVGKVIRTSPRTGQLVVRCLETRGAYKPGDEVSVAPWECAAYEGLPREGAT